MHLAEAGAVRELSEFRCRFTSRRIALYVSFATFYNNETSMLVSATPASKRDGHDGLMMSRRLIAIASRTVPLLVCSANAPASTILDYAA